jgi:hypothetical protein
MSSGLKVGKRNGHPDSRAEEPKGRPISASEVATATVAFGRAPVLEERLSDGQTTSARRTAGIGTDAAVMI